MRQLFTILFVLAATAMAAQTDRQYIRQGNKLFREGNYDKAEVAYRKAAEKNPRNPQAAYNLGTALMAQKKDSAAVEQLQKAGKMETSPVRRAAAYHNVGVICQSHKMFSEAIEAYKEALRNNPADDETRYNLELCKRQLKNQPQKGGGGDDDKKDQNKDKDKQDQKQNQDKKDQDKQDQQKQQQQPQMSKENAEQLLEAARQQEKQTQERMKDAMRQPNRRQLEKNW